MISGQEGLFFFFFLLSNIVLKNSKQVVICTQDLYSFFCLSFVFCCSMLSFEKNFFFLFYYFKKVYLLAINTPIFTLSWNVFISPFSPECIFTAYRIQDRQILSFCTGKMSFHTFWVPKVLMRRLSIKYPSSIQWVTFSWLFSRFFFFFLAFHFWQSDWMFLGMNSFWFILFGVHLASGVSRFISLSNLGEPLPNFSELFFSSSILLSSLS